MKDSLSIKNTIFSPPFFCAPMAGITHSAFRRLLSDFGGYGALWTEMLSAGALLHEDIHNSPFTKKRPADGKTVYQLRLTGDEDLPRVINRLEPLEPCAIDINCGCPAPEISKSGGGTALFNDFERLQKTVAAVRKAWNGLLFVKFRLGENSPTWRSELEKRLVMFEEEGCDALVLHPRFHDEKLKRLARWEVFEWATQITKLPLIASGDIAGRQTLASHRNRFEPVSGIMIGRMAVVKPWIFAEMNGLNPTIDYAEVWQRFYNYVNQDFPPEKAIGRIKEFTTYYAKNFFFGHDLYKAVQGAPNLQEVYDRALRFLEASPQLSANPEIR
jgi:tRNA-dihydrouridine synthase